MASHHLPPPIKQKKERRRRGKIKHRAKAGKLLKAKEQEGGENKKDAPQASASNSAQARALSIQQRMAALAAIKHQQLGRRRRRKHDNPNLAGKEGRKCLALKQKQKLQPKLKGRKALQHHLLRETTSCTPPSSGGGTSS